MDRRRALALSALGTTGFALSCGKDKTSPPDPLACADGSFEDLIQSIIETSESGWLDLGAGYLDAGGDPDTLLAASFHAGVRGLRVFPAPSHHGTMVVNSSALLRPNGEAVPAFWGLWFVTKWTSASTLGPVDESLIDTDWVAAQETFSPELADAAIAGLYRGLGEQATIDALAYYSARSRADLGHPTIYVSQSVQSLDRWGWSCAEPILRATARGLATGSTNTEAFERNRALLSTVQSGWMNGTEDDVITAQLLANMRTYDPDASADEVIALLNLGVSPESIWSCVVGRAAELMLGIGNVPTIHTLDAINALHFLYERTSEIDTKLLLLLQAAAWTAEWDLGEAETLFGIDTLTSGAAPGTAQEILDTAPADRMLAAQQTLGWVEAGGAINDVADAVRALVHRKGGGDPHSYKYPAAILDEVARTTSDFWRPRLLAAAACVYPTVDDPDWSQYDDVIAALG